MVTYTCFALQNPVFQPAMRLIAAITNSNPCIVTTTFDNQYVSGTVVRLDIPEACGMQQANQFVGPLTVIDALNFSLPLDTTTFGAFVIPVLTNPHIDICPQVVPIAENNDQLSAAERNVLPYPLRP
jgi:hypothetical protein